MPPTHQLPQQFLDFKPDYIASLAQQNSYGYVAQSLGDGNESSLYNNPKSKTTELYKLQATVAGLQCEYYTADYTPVQLADLLQAANGLNVPREMQTNNRMQVQVFSITLPYSVENLYVESRTNVTLNNILGLQSVAFKDSELVQLEGDFSYFFRAYVPRNETINAFTILAPNIMQQLLRDGGDYDFEFSGSKIYFYKTFSIMQASTIHIKQADYNHMLQFGLQSAQLLARAARPAQLTDTTNVPEMWQLYGTSNARLVASLALLIGGFMFIVICLLFPPFWPLAIIIGIVFFIRYRRLITKRQRLIREWQQ